MLRTVVAVGAAATLVGCEGSAPQLTSNPPAGECDGIGCNAPAPGCSACAPWQMCLNGACSCQPACSADTACQDDGCNGTCPCPATHRQTATGVWVPAAECHDTCASATWECSAICGEPCGECAPGTECVQGQCTCVPRCDGTRCDDGCGGECPCGVGTVCNAGKDCVAPDACHDTCASENLTCGEMCGTSCGACAAGESCIAGACAEAVSCSGCPLSLRLLERTLTDGKLSEVTVAIDFTPTDTEPRPRLADFRVRASRPVWARDATEGPALLQSSKGLYDFPPLEKPWRRGVEGTHQVLVYRSTSTTELSVGRVVTLKFGVDEWGPVRFSLQRREQTFAPPGSDAALQVSRYDGDVIVTR